MNIPSKIRIGSVDYTVEKTDEYLKLDGEQCLGIIDYEIQTIKIANNIQHNQRQEQTFLHEVIHAITKEFKIDFSEEEEVIVDKLALGLHQVIRDNLEEVKSIKIGDVQINYGEITDKVSEKMSENLRKSLGGIV